MKTQLYPVLILVIVQLSKGARLSKPKRGSFDLGYGGGNFGYSSDLTVSPSAWKGLPIHHSGSDNFLPVHVVSTGDYTINVDFPSPKRPPPSIAFVSNSIDKPVMESQEFVPPQSLGSAIIPRMPPPATPVNAAASNVPASRGAVYLGSGSLGVISLGNGAYALGSGSLGYSENRRRPRPSARVPLYPPIPASPHLIPAAVPSSVPAQPLQPFNSFSNSLDFDHPFFNSQRAPQVDQNGYEYLQPSRVAFGMPTPRPPTEKVRQQFATPTALQLQQPLHQPQLPTLPSSDFDFGFGQQTGGFTPI